MWLTYVRRGNINRTAVHLSSSQIGRMSSSSPAAKPEQLEFYCWPWVGIIANAQNDSRGYWLNEFSKYNPSGVEILRGGAQVVVVRFGDDLSGFKNAMEFEKSFSDQGCCRKEWIGRRASACTSVYGWFAREDDYKSDGPVGDYLRKKGGLRAISGLIDEAIEDRNKTSSNLLDEIDSRNQNMDGVHIKYGESIISLGKMLAEKDGFQRTFCEETRKVQSIIKRVLNEQKMSNFELEKKRRQLDSWSEELQMRESLIENERRKIEEEKKQNDLRSNALQVAAKKPRTTYENALKMLEEEQRETDIALAKVRELERDCAEMNKMKMKIEILKTELKIEEMKRLDGDDVVDDDDDDDDADKEVRQKIDQMKELLQEKNDEFNNLEALNNQLTENERQRSHELQEARKAVMKGMNDIRNGHRVNIGIKRIGEINEKPFKDTFIKRLPSDEAEVEARKLCCLWQEKIKDIEWDPFQIGGGKGNPTKLMINKDDELLSDLKNEWGDEVCSAVSTALLELEEYNPGVRDAVSEVWNFKQNRRATLKEAIKYALTQLKRIKRKRA
ncbi:hypothetical protein ABFS82_04G109400 [Erythranthe guttata]